MLKKLYIEPTSKCNLNCKMCFRHTWFDEPFCDLSLEDYKQVLATMPKSVETRAYVPQRYSHHDPPGR